MSKKIVISILLLRLALGFLFLYSGIDKLAGDFTAKGYLMGSTGPLKEIFKNMAGNSFVDFLVIWGEIGIGLALILGILIRFASFWGIIMMILFYMSTLPQKNGPISQHVIYILVFILLMVSGSGRYLGLDKVLEKKAYIPEKIKRWFLG
jgi:thiosulfate dehydrogenase [quinone] large subunit